jgi:hypothetical protein
MPGDQPIYSWSVGTGLRVYEGLFGNLLYEPKNSIRFFYPCHRVLTDLTLGALVSVRSLSTCPFCVGMLLASYVFNVFVLFHATLLSWWAGWSYFTKTTCNCLLLWEPVGASLRLVHTRTWLKPPVTNCFATDRSKAVTPMVLCFVNWL